MYLYCPRASSPQVEFFHAAFRRLTLFCVQRGAGVDAFGPLSHPGGKHPAGGVAALAAVGFGQQLQYLQQLGPGRAFKAG